ncbi:AAA family ATPase [Candidatus Uhrbacteria bacterium]|nr:AAA family ATPase [Candidatus Uhrbacteria bacterium]
MSQRKTGHNTGRSFEHGLVFGKFLGLHNGHLHLLRFARASCNRLTIIVCTLPDEPIPGAIRYQWVKDCFPDAIVIHHDDILPQQPEEHANFWNIWRESIQEHCEEKDFDALFGSEDYGWRMAEELGISYIPVNRSRSLVPISGTAVRENPMKEWRYIPEVARPYFAKRVRIIGPESAGKSTLTTMLAEHFDTVHVDEYARRLLEEYVKHKRYAAGEVRYTDIPDIARGQMVTEDTMARLANRVLFCDTDLRTTVFWSCYYFGRCPGWIAEEAKNRRYALTLLLSPDVPWIKDDLRPMPDLEERKRCFDWFVKEMEKNHEPYVIIEGNDWRKRLETAIEAVKSLGILHPNI